MLEGYHGTKEEQMQQQPRSTLEVIYENWRGYHAKLRDCIAPLTNEQLLLQPAARMWPLGQIVQHIISVRAGWFSGTLQDDDEAMNAFTPGPSRMNGTVRCTRYRAVG